MSPRPSRRRRDLRHWVTTASLASVGLILALSVGLGIGLGILLDLWLKTNGLMVILGTLLGIAAGFKQLIQIALRAGREETRAERERREHPERPGE